MREPGIGTLAFTHTVEKVNLPIWQDLLFSHQYLTSLLRMMPKKREIYIKQCFT